MKLLDLFCGAGGCSMGYHRAGFEVVGVDSKPQKNYPFEFIQMDAFEALEKYGKDFDVIHASPPCQRYSTATMTKNKKDRHPDFIADLRDCLISNRKPWIIENVMGAPMRWCVILCGVMFDLKVYRHRKFELSQLIFQPQHFKHPEKLSHNGWGVSESGYCGCSGHQKVKNQYEIAKKAMKINWMTWKELTQAIPPAYTLWIGKQILNAVSNSEH